ncbi:MAG: hypothetical protein AAF989_17305, partial [Planctomycetota bacterium]
MALLPHLSFLLSPEGFRPVFHRPWIFTIPFVLAVLTCGWLAGISLQAMAADDDSPEVPSPSPSDQWKAVDTAISKGLPKTAIEKLTPILDRAKREGKTAEWIKAIGQQIVLKESIQGNQLVEKITLMKAEIETADENAKPILQAILANWYWAYFQRNAWRFAQRTQTDTESTESDNEDFTKWSLRRILSEIDQRFDDALASADVLKGLETSDFAEILDNPTRGLEFRPTLFDVLAENAIRFYSAGEQAGAKVQDAFVVSASGPIFDDINAFLAWQPETADTDSAVLRAMEIHQERLRFHLHDEDQSALLDANLGRLVFAKNVSTGDEINARYVKALEVFAR